MHLFFTSSIDINWEVGGREANAPPIFFIFKYNFLVTELNFLIPVVDFATTPHLSDIISQVSGKLSL